MGAQCPVLENQEIANIGASASTGCRLIRLFAAMLPSTSPPPVTAIGIPAIGAGVAMSPVPVYMAGFGC
jgi:hypothetical protein